MAQASDLQAEQDEDGRVPEDQKSPEGEKDKRQRNKEESSSNAHTDAQHDTTGTGRKTKAKKLRSADALDTSIEACKPEDEGGAGELEEDVHEENPKVRKKKKHKETRRLVEATRRTGDEAADVAEDGKAEDEGLQEGDEDEEAEQRKTQKKKRKRKQLEEVAEAAQEVETTADGGGNGAGDCEEVQEPKDRSKRKKRKSTAEEDPGEVEGEEEGGTTQDDLERKKKKKKKRNAQAVDIETEGNDIAGTGEADDLVAVAAGADDDAAECEEPIKKKKKKVKKETTEEVEKIETEEEASCVKVCVANLPTSMGKGHIWRLFEDCGEIEDVFLLKDWWTGASRGVAFVTFSDAKASHAALRHDGEERLGQALRVNLALDRQKGKGGDKGSSGPKGWGKAAGRGEATGRGEDGDKGAGGPKGWGKAAGRGEGGGKGKGKDKGKGKAPAMFALNDKPAGCVGILLRGLSYAVTEADLQDCFAHCGTGPSRVRLLVDAGGSSKGKAFLDFPNEAAVDEAIKLTGTKLKGRKLCVEYSRPAGQ